MASFTPEPNVARELALLEGETIARTGRTKRGEITIETESGSVITIGATVQRREHWDVLYALSAFRTPADWDRYGEAPGGPIG